MRWSWGDDTTSPIIPFKILVINTNVVIARACHHILKLACIIKDLTGWLSNVVKENQIVLKSHQFPEPLSISVFTNN